jgi:hypothetical protein
MPSRIAFASLGSSRFAWIRPSARLKRPAIHFGSACEASRSGATASV